jgi:hypothetical protein
MRVKTRTTKRSTEQPDHCELTQATIDRHPHTSGQRNTQATRLNTSLTLTLVQHAASVSRRQFFLSRRLFVDFIALYPAMLAETSTSVASS